MSKKYFSAKELTGMPGMANTTQNINSKAKRESWVSRQRKGKGGGKEYHIDSLPNETRTYLAKIAAEQKAEELREASKQQSIQVARSLAIQHRTSIEMSKNTREQVAAQVAHLNGNDRQRAESKIIMLCLWDEFLKKSNLGKVQATADFLTLWRNGDLKLPSDQLWIRNFISDKLTYQTLNKWDKEPSRIKSNYGKRRGQTLIDTQPELKEFTLALIYEFPHIDGGKIHESMSARFINTDIQIPSKRSIERWVNNYKKENASQYTAITNPDQWKNQFMPAYGSIEAHELNERWEFDSTPADIMLTDGRYNIVGGIDVYSRRAKLLVTKTSTAGSVAKLLRDCILDWGVPDKLKTDNGADYVSMQIKTALRTLDIEQDISAPFSPWEKPHIERFFRTFSHSLLELLPGFIGHNVAERSVIEDRKQFSERLFKKEEVIEINMSSEDLQRFVDDWLDNFYMHQPHTGEGMNGKTPFQRITEWKGSIKSINNERALDILLAEVGTRKVNKDGIRLDGFNYIAAELGAISGQEVQVRKDPIDVGTIYVFKDGEFICAAEDARYVGIRRQEIAIQAKSNAASIRKEAKKIANSAKRSQKVKDIAEEILDNRRTQNNVSMLPHKSEDYSNSMLEAASEAASMFAQPDEQNEIIKPAQVSQMPSVTNPQEVHKRYLRIKSKLEQGGQLSQEENRFYKGYHNTPECVDMHEFFEDFGLLNTINE